MGAISISLNADTGLNKQDRITGDLRVNVYNIPKTSTWEYTLDGGTTWNDGANTSFELEHDRVYAQDDVQIRVTDKDGNVGTPISLDPVTTKGHSSSIDIADLTAGTLNADNEWEGTGIFDKIMYAVNKNIEGQYNMKRITSTDFATIYLGGLQTAISQSMNFILQEKKIEADIFAVVSQTEDSLLTNAKDRELKDRQILTANYDVAIKLQEALAAKERNGGYVVRYYYYANDADKNATPPVESSTTDITQVTGDLLRTELEDGDSVSMTSLEKADLVNKTLQVKLSGEKDRQVKSANISETNASIALKAQQEIEAKERNGGYEVTYSYYASDADRNANPPVLSTTTDLDAVVGEIVSTSATDVTNLTGDGISIVSLEKRNLKKKTLEIEANTERSNDQLKLSKFTSIHK